MPRRRRLLLRSVFNLLTVEKGFDAERMVIVDLNLSGPRYRSLEAADDVSAFSQ